MEDQPPVSAQRGRPRLRDRGNGRGARREDAHKRERRTPTEEGAQTREGGEAMQKGERRIEMTGVHPSLLRPRPKCA